MAKRLKLTAFSRFLLVMVFLVPLAYIGASWYNGEDGIQNIKELIGIEDQQAVSSEETATTTTTKTEEATEVRKERPQQNQSTARFRNIEQRLERLEDENKDLKEEIQRLNTAVADLKSNTN